MSSKGTSATSRKKGKLSKAEKLRLQKEEEEQKQREEEEAQLLAQEIEAVRLEKERLEREEIERLKAKQLEHREEELGEYRLLIDEKLEAADRWRRDVRIQAKWDRYMLCDGSPDPTIPQEINTFMSLWSEETSEDFQSVLNKSRLVLSLIEELEFLLLTTPPEELSEMEAAQYTQTVRQLQTLLKQKFNEATDHLLKNAAALSDIDTGNMQKIIKDKNVTLCIWANLNKNPSRTFLPRYQEPEETITADAIVRESSAGEWKTAEEEDKPGPGSVIVTEDEVKSEERKSVFSSLSSREDRHSVTESAHKDKDITEIHVGETAEGDSPAPLPDGDHPDDILEDDIVDLRQFSSLGGVYYFDVLVLPPQCKQVNGWTMVQLVGGGLQQYPYPTASSLITNLGVSLQEKDMDGLSAPPVAVSLKVPNNVIFFEEPQVARWDPEAKNWKTDLITNKEYNTERRELSFKMDAFHTFTLIQDSHLNMPYESWELTPNGPNEVSLMIACAFTDIQIEIKDDQCRLSSVSSTDSDLSQLIGKWMSPLRLKAAMQSAGLNVFPAEDSLKYVIVNKKNEEAEKMAYKEMAILCPSFTFGWSKWNQSCGYEHIVVKVKEKSDPPNDDWSLYMLSAQRTQRLKVSETSEIFSSELYDGSEFHSTLYHMIRDYCSHEAPERLKQSHHLFVDCVYQLLNMTKVLTYS
ncbi:dynein axonemal intermediate chain 7 isoform X2 [Mixophyes fleayi]|uniref:dynein axonemal intermediate chain 7 isoform X2 n=1 Tax=Mixophyes fleayi TaxID=3061075 RepID=UPI003F4E17C9